MLEKSRVRLFSEYKSNPGPWTTTTIKLLKPGIQRPNQPITEPASLCWHKLSPCHSVARPPGSEKNHIYGCCAVDELRTRTSTNGRCSLTTFGISCQVMGTSWKTRNLACRACAHIAAFFIFHSRLQGAWTHFLHCWFHDLPFQPDPCAPNRMAMPWQ